MEKIKDRVPEIIQQIKETGINPEEILAIYLFGSYYWGYANEQSDIDLYVILKEKFDKSQIDLGEISLRYISTLEETNSAIEQGSWARYYVLNFASELIYGEAQKISEYPREKIIDYLNEKEEEVALIPNVPLKWAFLTLMRRVFFINYAILNIASFNLADYDKTGIFTEDEVIFLNAMRQRLFTDRTASEEEKRRFIGLIKKTEEFIRGRY